MLDSCSRKQVRVQIDQGTFEIMVVAAIRPKTDRRVGGHRKKKQVGPGRPPKARHVNDRHVYLACTSATLDMYEPYSTEDRARYKDSLASRKLHLPAWMKLRGGQRQRPPTRLLTVGARTTGVSVTEKEDDRWLRSRLAIKIGDRKLIRLTKRASAAWDDFSPVGRAFMHFWRNLDVIPRLGVHGLGVFAARKLKPSAEGGTWKPLAYGLECSETDEDSLCMHVKVGAAWKVVWGPFAFFNGACEDHANCVFKRAQREWKPEWMSSYHAQVIWLTKPAAEGEELRLPYLFPGDVCPMCPPGCAA